jgi:hypothetical protein
VIDPEQARDNKVKKQQKEENDKLVATSLSLFPLLVTKFGDRREGLSLNILLSSVHIELGEAWSSNYI